MRWSVCGGFSVRSLRSLACPLALTCFHFETNLACTRARTRWQQDKAPRPSQKGQSVYQQVLPLAIAIEQELLKEMKVSDIQNLRQTVFALARGAAARLPESRDWRTLLPREKGAT